MFEQAFKNIDDVLWKEAGCTTELDYTEQTSWLLFLKYLDGLEQDRSDEAALEGRKYAFILDKPYRWETRAAPKGPSTGSGQAGQIDHNAALSGDDLIDFVNGKLFPYLHGFKARASGKTWFYQPDRLKRLNQIAIRQMKLLTADDRLPHLPGPKEADDE